MELPLLILLLATSAIVYGDKDLSDAVSEATKRAKQHAKQMGENLKGSATDAVHDMKTEGKAMVADLEHDVKGIKKEAGNKLDSHIDEVKKTVDATQKDLEAARNKILSSLNLPKNEDELKQTWHTAVDTAFKLPGWAIDYVRSFGSKPAQPAPAHKKR